MINKIMIFTCVALVGVSVLVFADDKQAIVVPESSGELVQEKAKFNESQKVYDDRDNKDIRAEKMVVKNTQSDSHSIKKAQRESDAKNALNDSKALNGNNEQDSKNEQYKKQLTLKF